MTFVGLYICGMAGLLIPLWLLVFIHVTLVVWATRDGEAGSVSAAASRSRRLEPQLSLGVWREITLKDICDTDCS